MVLFPDSLNNDYSNCRWHISPLLIISYGDQSGKMGESILSYDTHNDIKLRVAVLDNYIFLYFYHSTTGFIGKYSHIHEIKPTCYKVQCVAKPWPHTTLPTQLRRIDSVNKLWLVVHLKVRMGKYITHVYLYHTFFENIKFGLLQQTILRSVSMKICLPIPIKMVNTLRPMLSDLNYPIAYSNDGIRMNCNH